MGTNNPYFDAPLLRPQVTEDGASYFQLVEDWKVTLDDGTWLVVPKGSRSNFASVPWFFRWIISSTDPVIVLPAIVHDYLVGEWQNYPPLLYREIPDEEGVNFVVSEPLYGGTGYDWKASAKLFRKLALSFRGRTAHFKARLCYVAIIVFGTVGVRPHE
jgi:hypothetical protein